MIQCGDQMNSKNVPAEGHVSSQADEVLYRHEMAGEKVSSFLYKVFQITACINAQKMIENSLP
jgi:hypothetical protein